MVENNIGNLVKYHRKKSGLSQSELARISGVGKTVVFDIEKGKSTIRLSTLEKILKTLNMKIEVISPLMEQYLKESHAKS